MIPLCFSDGVWRDWEHNDVERAMRHRRTLVASWGTIHSNNTRPGIQNREARTSVSTTITHPFRTLHSRLPSPRAHGHGLAQPSTAHMFCMEHAVLLSGINERRRLEVVCTSAQQIQQCDSATQSRNSETAGCCTADATSARRLTAPCTGFGGSRCARVVCYFRCARVLQDFEDVTLLCSGGSTSLIAPL